MVTAAGPSSRSSRAAQAQHFADRGTGVRRGDYADPGSLPSAFEGADQLLLVSSNDPGADAVSLHRAAIDAAVTVGVGRILYTSHQGAAPDTPFGPGRDHFATEQILAESGVAWTSLRNGFYAHSLHWLTGRWRETGVITVPADGPVSWTAREDAAEAAAVILASNGRYEGPTTLTANAAPTFQVLARGASELSGRRTELAVLDPDEWVAAQVAAGRQEFRVRFLLRVYQPPSRASSPVSTHCWVSCSHVNRGPCEMCLRTWRPPTRDVAGGARYRSGRHPPGAAAAANSRTVRQLGPGPWSAPR